MENAVFDRPVGRLELIECPCPAPPGGVANTRPPRPASHCPVRRSTKRAVAEELVPKPRKPRTPKPRKPRKPKNTETETANFGDEAQRWQMTDALLGSMDAAEYKHAVLGLTFLKHISDAFEGQRARLETDKRKGGEFYTPPCVIELSLEMLRRELHQGPARRAPEYRRHDCGGARRIWRSERPE